MSGIEVAGIALAGFPILANGLKYIAKSIETARRWKLYRTKLEDYVDMVEAASVYFRETLFQLLEDIVHSDDELQLLMRDPGGESWKKPEYEERLRQRLERSHTSYMKRVLKVVQALRSMCESLGVDSDGKVRVQAPGRAIELDEYRGITCQAYKTKRQAIPFLANSPN